MRSRFLICVLVQRTWGDESKILPHVLDVCPQALDGMMIADTHINTLFFVAVCNGYAGHIKVLSSHDRGETFGHAIDVTNSTRLKPTRGGAPAARDAYIPALGGGIQTTKGRLIAQFYGLWCFKDPSGSCNTTRSSDPDRRKAFAQQLEQGFGEVSFIVYSDDHGISWRSSQPFGAYGAEGEAVQLSKPGHLMYNFRFDGPMTDACPDGAPRCDTGWGANITVACGPSSDGRPAPVHCRCAMFSSDDGSSWRDASGGTGWFGSPIPDLPDPGCKGATTRWEEQGALLATNVQDQGRPGFKQNPRYNLTLSISHDEGRTWPRRLIVFPARLGRTGYSDVRMTGSGKVAIHLDTEQNDGCRATVARLCPNSTSPAACVACALRHNATLRAPAPVPNHPGLLEPPCFQRPLDDGEPVAAVFSAEVAAACEPPLTTPIDGSVLALVDPHALL